MSPSSLGSKTWSVSTSGFNGTVMHGLPLVVEHPSTGQACLRFHEPWGKEKTQFDATTIAIDDDTQETNGESSAGKSGAKDPGVRVAEANMMPSPPLSPRQDKHLDSRLPSPEIEKRADADLPAMVDAATEEPVASTKLHPDSAAICHALTSALHDRRVAYYHAWQKGDVIVNDNILTMHTRSDFKGGCDRELWRIHFD